MKGLLQHPAIVLELLKHVTPLEYLVLRRTFTIFIRNPTIYPLTIGLHRKMYGLELLMKLEDRHFGGIPSCGNDRNYIDNIVDVTYDREDGLKIRDFDELLSRKFLCDANQFLHSWTPYCHPKMICNVFHDLLLEYAYHDYHIYVHNYHGYSEEMFKIVKGGNFNKYIIFV